MTPLNDRVREYMEGLGYKWYNDTLGTYGFAKKALPPVYVETATEWYLASLQAQKNELETFKSSEWYYDELFSNYVDDRISEIEKLMETDQPNNIQGKES